MLIFGLTLMAGGLGVLVLFRGELKGLGLGLRPRCRRSWRLRRVLKFWVYRLLGGSVDPSRRAGEPSRRAGQRAGLAGRASLPGDQPTSPSTRHRRDGPRAVGRATPPPPAIVHRTGDRPTVAPRPRRLH